MKVKFRWIPEQFTLAGVGFFCAAVYLLVKWIIAAV